MVRHIFPNGAVKIEDPTDGRTFKVNRQRLKSYVENVDHFIYLDEIPLVDIVHRT